VVKKKAKTPKGLSKIIKTDISAAFKDKTMWNMIGREAVGMIRANKDKGKGATSPKGNVEKFGDVSPSYAKYRKPSSPLAPKRGAKSKLIASGKMFRDMSWKAYNFKTHLGFKTRRSADIAKYHDKDGAGKSKVLRPFFNISKTQFNLLTRLMKKFIDKTLQK